MAMREFLYHKLIQFNQDAVQEFQQEIVGTVPCYATPAVDHAAMWGSTDRGRWTVNAVEGRFYENTGRIHIVGWLRDQDYYDLYVEIYNKLPDKFSQPISIEQNRLKIANHPGGIDSNMFYIQLQTPNNSYGLPYSLDHLLDPLFYRRRNLYACEFVDNTTWLLQQGRWSIGLGPELEPNTILSNKQGIFYTVLPRFNITLAKSVEQHLTYLDQILLDQSTDRDSILQQARDQWLPLIN
jgi:hypothetical protein